MPDRAAAGSAPADPASPGAPPRLHDRAHPADVPDHSSATEHTNAQPSTVAALVGDLASMLSVGRDAGHFADEAIEAREVVAALLDVPRFWPSTHAADPVEPALVRTAREAAARRARGAPLAYAVRRANF